ncbi:MAG TPA: Flp pilus assembly protein CpaB [Armatimonadota bacterium]|jgi:pilus assembly protein CpaB
MAKINQATSLGLAAVFGLATAGLVYYYVGQSRGAGGQAQPEPTVQIVVARDTISPRATIKPEMLTQRAYALRGLPDGAIRDFNGAIGRVALRQIPSGTAVTSDSIADRGPGLGMSYSIKDNRRAVAVPIDPVSGVAGYLKPGDRVDVLATFSGHESDVTRVVLQDIELMAIGNQPATTANVKDKPNAPAEAVTATLAVNPEQMSVLALVTARAKIQLALRSPDDHAYVPPASITTTQVFGGPARPTAPPAPAAAPAAPPVRTVEIQPSPAPRPTPRPASKPPVARRSVEVTRGTETKDVPVQ